jgi:hypothetical protein
MARRISSAAKALTRRARRAGVRAGLGASGVCRSLPIRGEPEHVRELWSDATRRSEVLAGLPALRGAWIHCGPAQGDWGATVTVRLELQVPLPRPAAQLLGGKAVRRLKALAETGEVPTTEHNPSARADAEVPGE